MCKRGTTLLIIRSLEPSLKSLLQLKYIASGLCQPTSRMRRWTSNNGMHKRNHSFNPSLGIRTNVSSNFGKDFERSFQNTIEAPGGQLPPAASGRCKLQQPEERPAQCPLLKPSRPGEVQPASELLGKTVQKWFLQLRRMQSMVHALKAGKTSWDAQIYRADLWRAIKRAKGHDPDFQQWWAQRPIQLQGTPSTWPTFVPQANVMELLYTDYELNYRKFESWHNKQRTEMLNLTLQENHSKIFSLLKPLEKLRFNILKRHATSTFCKFRKTVCKFILNMTPNILQSAEVDGYQMQIEKVEGELLTLSKPLDTVDAEVIQITKHYSTVEQLQAHLADFWQKRWWREIPSPSDWDRMFRFCEAYIPPQEERHDQITVSQWKEINKRYGKSSARGPDGISHRDLHFMPFAFEDHLVTQINSGRFPAQLHTGFIHPLPKIDDARRVGEFRPVIICSMIHRSWASLRSRQILRRMATFTGAHQFGFILNKECIEVWMAIQAVIEEAILLNKLVTGFVSDVIKTFEFLPRQPIMWLGRRLGISRRVLRLWSHFLTSTERRFMLSGQIGPSLQSNSGFPEGCGMSCTAVSLLVQERHRCSQTILHRSDALAGSFCLCPESYAFIWGEEQTGPDPCDRKRPEEEFAGLVEPLSREADPFQGARWSAKAVSAGRGDLGKCWESCERERWRGFTGSGSCCMEPGLGPLALMWCLKQLRFHFRMNLQEGSKLLMPGKAVKRPKTLLDMALRSSPLCLWSINKDKRCTPAPGPSGGMDKKCHERHFEVQGGDASSSFYGGSLVTFWKLTRFRTCPRHTSGCKTPRLQKLKGSTALATSESPNDLVRPQMKRQEEFKDLLESAWMGGSLARRSWSWRKHLWAMSNISHSSRDWFGP